jgi:hypothetical protein
MLIKVFFLRNVFRAFLLVFALTGAVSSAKADGADWASVVRDGVAVLKVLGPGDHVDPSGRHIKTTEVEVDLNHMKIPEADGRIAVSSRDIYDIRCAEGTYRDEKSEYFSGDNQTGDEVFLTAPAPFDDMRKGSVLIPEIWNTPRTGSFEEYFISKLCLEPN